MILVTALIGLFETGPLLESLILSKIILFYSVNPLLLPIAHDFLFKSSGLIEPYLCMPLTGLALYNLTLSLLSDPLSTMS